LTFTISGPLAGINFTSYCTGDSNYGDSDTDTYGHTDTVDCSTETSRGCNTVTAVEISKSGSADCSNGRIVLSNDNVGWSCTQPFWGGSTTITIKSITCKSGM